MSRLRRVLTEQVYARLFHSPHWKVGWRRLDGSDLWDRKSLAGTRWNVLPNPRRHFLADPIAIEHDGRTVLFVEDFDHRAQKGIISALEFSADGPVGPLLPVLEEPWHLSYPFVMAFQHQVWMIPESLANREVSLYRADPFPSRWVKETVLLHDVPATDATLHFRDGVFWMFVTFDTTRQTAAELHLFHADNLFGPWTPHPKNPVMCDTRSARAAGPIVARDGRLFRPVQDCSQRYGASVGLAEILRLDRRDYAQQVMATLTPCREWPGRRLHTLSQAGAFEFIDGSANTLRWM